MRKLLCVTSPNGAEFLDGTPSYDYTSLIVGNEYTAYNEVFFDDGVYYQLVGFQPGYIYHGDLFAVLPDATAEQMAEEKFEAIANLETVLV